MSFLFPKTAGNSQRKLLQQTNTAIGQAKIKPKIIKQMTAPLSAERERLSSSGLTPVSFGGPGYGINIDNSGNIAMNRTPESQGVMDKLLGGLNTDEQAYSDLLTQIRPGFGRLTNARVGEIKNAATKAVGNLRDQLARRRVAGASFANDQVGSLQAEYDRMTEQAIAESMVEELKMTGDVIGARTQARNQTLAQAFDQTQFEGTIGANLLMNTQKNMQDIQTMMVDLTKTIADIELRARLGNQASATSLSGTYLGQGSEFAGLKAQEAAAPGNFVGQLAGTALGSYLGNPAVFGATTVATQ